MNSDAEEILAILADHPKGIQTLAICRFMNRSQQYLGDAFEDLLESRQAVSFAGLWFKPDVFLEQAVLFIAVLDAMHKEDPHKPWQSREEVVSIMECPWSGKPLDRIVARLAEIGRVETEGNLIRSKNFVLELTEKQVAFLDRVCEVLERTPVDVPYTSDIAKALNIPVQAVDEILSLGTLAKKVVNPGVQIYYTPKQIEDMKERIRAFAGKQSFTAGEIRELFESSRRYVIPILEHMDSIGFTTRTEDSRTINPS